MSIIKKKLFVVVTSQRGRRHLSRFGLTIEDGISPRNGLLLLNISKNISEKKINYVLFIILSIKN